MRKKTDPNLSLFPGGDRRDLTLPPRERDIYTVSRLNREARMLLEKGLPLLWLEGEISNLSQPSSGHWYFSLKDAEAQVRCAMFRQKNRLTRCVPSNGLMVQVRVRVSLYEPRGEYQLIVEHMEETGEGLLRRQFELLKARLEREGLFATARKRPLPVLPRRIGVITSPTGAAIRDILHILQRRFPAIPVLLYPTQVQGAAAAPEVAAAIRLASARAECDVLIVARGGGTLEDLWAFNEEIVARAIFDCAIPVVVGVGHEIDFTIADFVADVRAPTPSGAAEIVVPDRRQFIEQFVVALHRLTGALQQQLQNRGAEYSWLKGRLMQAHPGVHVRHQAQRLDDFEQRLTFATLRRIEARTAHFNQQRLHLWRLSPLTRLREDGHRMTGLHTRLIAAMHRTIGSERENFTVAAGKLSSLSPFVRVREAKHYTTRLHTRLKSAIEGRLAIVRRRADVAASALNAVSPLATLDRGYAIVTRLPDNKLLRSASEAKLGDRIEARLHQGHLRAVIEGKDE